MKTMKVGNLEIDVDDLYIPEDFSIRTTKDVLESFVSEVNYKLGEQTEDDIKDGHDANITAVIDLNEDYDDFTAEDITKEICDMVCEVYKEAGWPIVVWSTTGKNELTFTFYFHESNHNLSL